MDLSSKLNISKPELKLLVFESIANLALIANKLMVDMKLWPQKIPVLEDILPTNMDINPRKIMKEFFGGNYVPHGALMILGYTAGYVFSGMYTKNESKRIVAGLTSALALQGSVELLEYAYESGLNTTAYHYQHFMQTFLPVTDARNDTLKGAAVMAVAVICFYAYKTIKGYQKKNLKVAG